MTGQVAGQDTRQNALHVVGMEYRWSSVLDISFSDALMANLAMLHEMTKGLPRLFTVAEMDYGAKSMLGIFLKCKYICKIIVVEPVSDAFGYCRLYCAGEPIMLLSECEVRDFLGRLLFEDGMGTDGVCLTDDYIANLEMLRTIIRRHMPVADISMGVMSFVHGHYTEWMIGAKLVTPQNAFVLVVPCCVNEFLARGEVICFEVYGETLTNYTAAELDALVRQCCVSAGDTAGAA